MALLHPAWVSLVVKHIPELIGDLERACTADGRDACSDGSRKRMVTSARQALVEAINHDKRQLLMEIEILESKVDEMDGMLRQACE